MIRHEIIAEVNGPTGPHGQNERQTLIIGRASSEDNCRMMAAAPRMYATLEMVLAWITNVNVTEPSDLARTILLAMESAGAEPTMLDSAANALKHGAARLTP
jgi:hypothetical protein